MKRLVCLVWVAVFSGFTFQGSSFAAKQQRPNFVVIFTDDQGYADLGCFGGTHVKTPRIDQMAAEGARLTSFYVAAPVCTPSRAALMTGCYPKRVDMATGSNFGVLLAGDTKGLNPKEITIAEVLKTAGYKTGMFGKWHLGDQPEFLPTRQGFDEYFGIPYSHDIHPFHPKQSHYHFPPLPLLDGETVIEMEPDADYLTKRLTERAVQFIEANKERPFFLYLPHPIPHRPLHASPPFMKDVAEPLKAKLAEEKQNHNIDYKTRDKIFKQAISEIDWSVGQVLDALKKQGIDDNTLVIFTSDNGPAVGLATPLRGKKGSTFEGGMREPTVVRWPGKIPAGTVNDELMTTMDLLPTFAKLAGAEVPSDRVIDGRDIWPVLTGNGKSPHEAFFYHKGNTLQAVRSGKWKLHLAAQGKAKGKGRKKKGKGAAALTLYNLEQDIGETTNVAKDNPDVVARLRGYMAAFEKDLAENSRPAAFVKNPTPLSKTDAARAKPQTTGQPVVFDFESGDLTGWTIVSGAFGKIVSDRARFHVKDGPYNRQGKWHLSTLDAPKGKSDAYVGELRSDPFTLNTPTVSFLVGGGNKKVYVAICTMDGTELKRAAGSRSEVMKRVVWELPKHMGQPLYLKIVDNNKGGWGHITFDDFREGAVPATAPASAPEKKSAYATVTVTHSAAAGIGEEEGVMRRDPSDIIKVGDLYYVWYSKGSIGPGYDATVWYATSPDGHTWTEKGMALAKGEPGGWDGASVFTPNILVAEGRYWLFYTGTSRKFGKPFNPDSKIGIAVSDSPDGPWKRLATNPALKNSDNPEDFDSHLVDDACLIVRDGKYCFYYKGRQLGKGPRETRMGLAIADKPAGPYIKHPGNPVIPGNHEVLVWPQGTGVATMIGTTGPKEITNSILYSEDGVHFSKTHDVKNGPWAGGAYRPEAFTQSGTGKIPQWGVEIGRSKGKKKGKLPFLQRFDVKEEK